MAALRTASPLLDAVVVEIVEFGVGIDQHFGAKLDLQTGNEGQLRGGMHSPPLRLTRMRLTPHPVTG